MLVINIVFLFTQLFVIVGLGIVSINILRFFSTTVKMAATVAPAIFVNHGGGPLPLIGDHAHIALTKFLRDEVKNYVNFKDIKAIILVTAHWEEDSVTISSAEHHDLYYDYYNFPAETYKLKYAAPGEPALAERIHEALKTEGIQSKLDSKRGWDHGVFVPMLLINPAANVPIVQISVLTNQNAEQHYKLGEVLGQFRKEGVAVFGSGMSYHNMRQFFTNNSPTVVNAEFDDYLHDTCTADPNTRRAGLLKWEKQKGAYEAHPKGAAEHFMPLIVVAGAGGNSKGERIFNWDYKNKFRLSGFIWKGE